MALVLNIFIIIDNRLRRSFVDNFDIKKRVAINENFGYINNDNDIKC